MRTQKLRLLNTWREGLYRETSQNVFIKRQTRLRCDCLNALSSMVLKIIDLIWLNNFIDKSFDKKIQIQNNLISVFYF